MNIRVRVLALLFALFGAVAAAAENAGTPDPNAPAFDFAASDAVADLGLSLVPRDPNAPLGRDAWFTLPVRNGGAGAGATRVLVAADTPDSALRLYPAPTRPRLIEAAGSGPGVVVERASAFGRYAFRVSVPPSQTANLALHFEGVDSGRPMLLAWSEPALVAHNRQLAVLAGLVSGLLTAAMAFAAGSAVLSGRIFARWAALFLAAALIAQLAADGLFDDLRLTSFGGPYGLVALAQAVALAAAIRMLDYVGSFEALYRGARFWRDAAALAVVALGLAAFAGVPATGLIVRVLLIVGAAAAAGHLAHCGRLGIAGARRLAPAATVFALVTAAAGVHALGVFGDNLVAPMAIGGFSAAGALLVALVTAIPIEPAMERLRALHEAHGHDDTMAAVTDEDFEQQREIAAVTASHQGVFDLDLKTGLLSLSSEAAAMFGLPAGAAELGWDAWLSRIHKDDRAVYQAALERHRRIPGIAFRLEFRAATGGGRTAWFELRATMTGPAARADRCLGLIADVTARKARDTSAPDAGAADALTGLGNRTALLARLEGLGDALARSALAVFDLDRFKSVNDSLGHDGADTALKGFAARLRDAFAGENAKSRITLYRVGGDMFAALGRDVSDLGAFGVSVLDLVSAPFTIDGRDVYLSTSVGVASGGEADDGLDLLARAELAMGQAKREGGNRVSLYSGAITRPAPRDAVALEAGLRRALERDEIEVHYQPVIRLADGAVAGFEALLRWRHPERGLIDPEEFIAHAEQSGLIVRLGRLVLERATADLRGWQQAFRAAPPLFVSVNVAWRQIADGDFASGLSSLLRESGLAPGSLKLEVTESAVMAGKDKAEAALKSLKATGAGLAIDDFGTGHSALGHLVRFPFDTIKIDKSFVAAASDASGAAILASIVSLARELRLAAVAEGVQTREDAARLKRMGCEYGQGFYFGAPLPASKVGAFISAGAA